MQNKTFILPFTLPIACFALAILAGSLLLWADFSHPGRPLAYLDALYIATSSVCVTGLASVDPASTFSTPGLAVMMVLMQLGGLGIVTYGSLIIIMLRQRVSLTDRLAVGQALLNDSSFHLGRFIQRLVCMVLLIELAGALCLYLMEPEAIGPFRAAFLAISAFCNAGFAPWADNLAGWREHLGLNAVVMSLIVLGGLGFAVLDEAALYCRGFFLRLRLKLAGAAALPPRPALSFYARLVVRTSLALILGGAAFFWFAEYFTNNTDYHDAGQTLLPALFQSVTCRTAGFNTVNIGGLTDITLLAMIFLMLVGGASGSCAGGIKISSFRVLLGFIRASLRGRAQVSVAGRGVSPKVLNRLFTLLTFAGLTVALGTFALTLTEGGNHPHGQTPFQALDLFFETVSAFATVGLSTGVSPLLSDSGKAISCLLMFIGRLGPIWLVTTLQQLHCDRAYRLPDTDLPVG